MSSPEHVNDVKSYVVKFSYIRWLIIPAGFMFYFRDTRVKESCVLSTREQYDYARHSNFMLPLIPFVYSKRECYFSVEGLSMLTIDIT